MNTSPAQTIPTTQTIRAVTQPENDLDELSATISGLADEQFFLGLQAAEQEKLAQAYEKLKILARRVNTRRILGQQIDVLVAQVNAGFTLEDVLETLYHNLRKFIPFDRMGLSLIEEDGKSVRAVWARADFSIQLSTNYRASLTGSSLQQIIATRQPRIINDLVEYLDHKPNSESTRLIIAEGLRSSLTCPLIAEDRPVGFLFFSSKETNTYTAEHASTYQRLANQLAIIVEKARLVNELQRQKQASELQNQELSRLNRLKDSVLRMAAHDLRSPVAYMQMASGMLLELLGEDLDEQARHILSDIQARAVYTISLLDDLLDFEHIEAGGLEISQQPLVLERYLRDATDRHRIQAEAKNIQLVIEGSSQATVVGDALRVQQVLDNLLSNAIKYSPQGSTVKVRTRAENTTWQVEVEDQGAGIPAAELPYLFQDFTRLSNRPTAGEKSNGLGLAIARRIIESLGGQIGVDSQPGQGAIFWFRLPAWNNPGGG